MARLVAELDRCDASARDNDMVPLDAAARHAVVHIARHLARLPIPSELSIGAVVSPTGGGLVIADFGSRRVIIEALPGGAIIIARKDKSHARTRVGVNEDPIVHALHAISWLCEASCPRTTA